MQRYNSYEMYSKLVSFPVCLAPMVGLSHVALRLLIRDYLPSDQRTIWPTEMLNSRRLPYENMSQTPEALRHQSEQGLVPQILGNEEKYISASVQKLEDWGASGIDINMGCPVAKALRHNYGVALMGDVKYAASVVRMTCKSTRLPVSVKLRAIENTSILSLQEFVSSLLEAGASWITLHPRTATQKRRGKADWQQIKFLKENFSVPIIGNGDVQSAGDVFNMLQTTGCDQVMVGRALAARPWLLWQVGEQLGLKNPAGKTGFAPRTPAEEGAEYGRCLLKLFKLMFHFFNDDLAIRKFRFYVKTTSVWLQFGHELYSQVCSAKNKLEIEAVMQSFFQDEVLMSEYTELRQ